MRLSILRLRSTATTVFHPSKALRPTRLQLSRNLKHLQTYIIARYHQRIPPNLSKPILRTFSHLPLPHRTMTTLSRAANVESAKRLAAYAAVDEHFPSGLLPGERNILVGIGSGSTVVYVVERITQLDPDLIKKCIFIPTGYQSRQLIVSGGLTLGDVDSHNSLGIAFDGADEVDPYLNCIKGGGACLFQEKLVAVKAENFIVVADYRKRSNSLCTAYLPGVPIEVVPPAVSYVIRQLRDMGSVEPKLRMGGLAKAGPCVTDNGNFIIDAPFPDGILIEGGVSAPGIGIGGNENVELLARAIKNVVGVVEHGIFWAEDKKPVVAYFGMEDGSMERWEREKKRDAQTPDNLADLIGEGLE